MANSSRTLLAICAAFLCTVSSVSALTITISEHGTQGSVVTFSDGTYDFGPTVPGTTGESNFLIGGADFYTGDVTFTNVSVISGSDLLGFNAVYVAEYGSIPGTGGNINAGIDFQTSTALLGVSSSLLNGLSLHAPSWNFSSFIEGTYLLGSYYTSANYSGLTDGGGFVPITLIVGEPAPVPLPASLPLLVAGLGAIGLWGRKRRS